jgi:hypothetical protein
MVMENAHAPIAPMVKALTESPRLFGDLARATRRMSASERLLWEAVAFAERCPVHMTHDWSYAIPVEAAVESRPAPEAPAPGAHAH